MDRAQLVDLLAEAAGTIGLGGNNLLTKGGGDQPPRLYSLPYNIPDR